MADIDVNPFGDHDNTEPEPMGDNIPLTPVGGGSTWEPEREHHSEEKVTKKNEVKNCTNY